MGHLLRGVDAKKIYPPYYANVPKTVTNGEADLSVEIATVILTTEMFFTFVYALVYLNAKHAYTKAVYEQRTCSDMKKEYEDNELNI
jgi:hypothetical protein